MSRITVTGRFLDTFEQRFGPVARGLGRLVRPTIVAKPGHTLVWGDWSAIEARVLPWLANSRGAERVLDIFRTNDKDPSLPDIYKIEAGNIFGRDPATIGKGPERQTGKVAVLSLGFGGALGALQNMATNYGIYLADSEAQRIVDIWRTNNAWAKTFWHELWDAVLTAMDNPAVIVPVGRVAYTYDPGYLGGTVFCALPDGRLLSYPDIRWTKREYTDKKTGETELRDTLTYLRGYGRAALWYGVLAENITQATAASLLRELLTTLEYDYSDWMPPIGHTHDEALTMPLEIDADRAEAKLLELMTTNKAWNAGLPLAAETTRNWYYSKAT